MPGTDDHVLREAMILKEKLSVLDQFGYTNDGLEGPLDEPTYAQAVVAMYPRDNEPAYRVFGLDSSLPVDYDRLRQRILGYRLRAAVAERQRELVDIHNALPELIGEAARLYLESVFNSHRLPLYFILFGITADGGKETAHLFHHYTMPAIICLEEIQERVRRKLDAEDGGV